MRVEKRVRAKTIIRTGFNAKLVHRMYKLLGKETRETRGGALNKTEMNNR
jgi:hypothetical protein